jgi:flagellar biosynthesis/type III secretory pathway M-ring protein FliF/YscJ
MSKKHFVDLELIQKFIKKNKKHEVKIKSDILSTNLVFAFLFVIGFMFIIIYYKYIEKKREKEIEEKKIEEEKKQIAQIEKEHELLLLSPNFQNQKSIHNLQVRNAVVQTKDIEDRDKKEDELRKKYIVDLNSF